MMGLDEWIMLAYITSLGLKARGLGCDLFVVVFVSSSLRFVAHRIGGIELGHIVGYALVNPLYAWFGS
ncbi:MAG: hypothetical protein ACYCQJ_09405 [Nitrososphaerales archaeon]